MKAFVRRFDKNLTNRITSLPGSLKILFLVVTNLGHPVTTITIGAVILFAGRVDANTRLIVAGASIWVALALGSLLKLLFGRSRPLTEYAAGIRLDKLSFPSGHTTGSTIAYGLLAYISWQTLSAPLSYMLVSFLATLIVLIGVSRVYLGAHFPSDVIAGWLLGGSVLLIVIVFLAPL